MPPSRQLPLLRTHTSPRERNVHAPQSHTAGSYSSSGRLRRGLLLARRFWRRRLLRALLLLGLALSAVRVVLFATRFRVLAPDMHIAGTDQPSSALADALLLPARVVHSTLTEASPYAYAAFFASEDFLPAVQVLLHSLSATAPAYPLVLGVVEDRISPRVLAAALRHASMPIEVQVWSAVPPPPAGKQAARWTINWTKLRLWQLERFRKVLYLDADVLVLQNLDDVFDTAIDRFLGTPDWGRWTRPGSTKMNGGVFLFEPSAVQLPFMAAFASRMHQYRSEEAEQGLLNGFFGSKSCCLPHIYNTQKTLAVHYPALFNLSAIKVLHFTGEKPWREWGTAAGRSQRRALVSPAQRLARAAADSWDGDDYTEVHARWHRAYFQARDFDSWLSLFEVRGADAAPDALAKADVVHGNEAPAALDAVGIRWPVALSHTVHTQTEPPLAAAAASASHLRTPYAGFVRGDEEPPNWTAVDFGQSADARKMYVWRCVLAPRGLAAAVASLHPGLARSLRRDALPVVARSAPAVVDELSNHEFGAAFAGSQPRYVRTSALIMHVFMLRDFTAWAALHWGEFLLDDPPDDAAVAVEELLLNVWVALTNASVVDVPY
jgi:hypothetical protein